MPKLTDNAAAVAGADFVTIKPRIENPGAAQPDALEGIQKLLVAVQKGGVSRSVLELTHMRASQINGCSSCIEGTINHARRTQQPLDERLLAVAAWHESSRFTAQERAALGVAEAITRLADREDAVSDAVWSAAAEHFDEKQLAALVLHVALTNLFNRVNVATRQPAGQW